ncbi:MAG: hypothetical protein C0412_01850 [Flavobacterium sp.]|nr:hypothetical protein [Flavobacterium sp.]
MKNILTYAILIFILQSCISVDETKEDSLPYYQFTNDELKKLITKSDIGDERIYKNQDNEFIKFIIYKSQIEKSLFSTGNFSSRYSSNHYYYDNQEVLMWYKEGNVYSSCKIKIIKYPEGSNYQTQYPIVGTPKFYGYFEFPIWNGYNKDNQYDNTIYINFDLPTIIMNFNEKTYLKVRVFESGKTTILSPSVPTLMENNVNKIYYDDNYGIIGFDDINGKLWRLQ